MFEHKSFPVGTGICQYAATGLGHVVRREINEIGTLKLGMEKWGLLVDSSQELPCQYMPIIYTQSRKYYRHPVARCCETCKFVVKSTLVAK